MNTQTFAQAITDEELQAAGGGIFGKVAGKVIGAMVPKVTVAGAARAGAQAIVLTGAEAIANGLNADE